MAARSFGYIQDTTDKNDLDMASLSLVSSDLPKQCSLQQFRGPRLDQVSSNACVGFGLGGALLSAEHAAGVELDLPSPSFIYFNARRQGGVFITDSGTRIRWALSGLLKLGACKESLWPFSTNPLRLNRRPSFEAYMGAYARCGGEYRRIFETGAGRTLAVKAAIVARMPVVFGTQVGVSFMRPEGPEIIGPPLSEPLAGGHCEYIDGYEDVPGHGTLFDVVNSYGRHWRNDGCWRMTEEYLQWGPTADLWCIRGWQALRVVG